MLTKSERTRDFILETVAPLFNKMGYAATAMSDITDATGLTKGAIYGHFDHKEDLAIAAFKFNVKRMLSKIESYLKEGASPLQKLGLLARFYSEYENNTKASGGCPILNVGTDSNHHLPHLLAKVQEVIKRMENYLENLIEEGQSLGEIRPDISGKKYSRQIYSLLQGAVFMSHTMHDPSYLTDAAEQLYEIIEGQLKF